MGMNQIGSNEIRLDQVRSDKNDKIDSNLDQPWWLPLVQKYVRNGEDNKGGNLSMLRVPGQGFGGQCNP